jgi:Na+/proline symporter
MATERLSLAPDAESISANHRRERFLVRVAACLVLLALVSTTLYYLFQASELARLLVAIGGATSLGLAAFVMVAVVWRRVCAARGHSFRETDVFPDGRVMVYQCRHCGEQRYVDPEATPTPKQTIERTAPRSEWQDYRRRHRTAVLGCAIGLPVVVLVFVIGSLIFGLHSPGPFIIASFIWGAWWLWQAFHVTRFPCPRCGAAFNSARACGRCGLQLYEQPSCMRTIQPIDGANSHPPWIKAE